MANNYWLGRKMSEAHKRAISNGVKKNLPSTAFEKGKHFHPITEFKKGQTENDKNINWKGDKVGYFALHNWISRKLGKANKCEANPKHTLTAIRFEWANISNKYLRDFNDWIQLCKSCHMKFDNVTQRAWETRKGATFL